MPIVRTFCPPVAGAAEMTLCALSAYDIVGGCVWAGSTILGGYFLASLVPNISQRINYVIAVVVVLSFLPAIIAALRSRSRQRRIPQPFRSANPAGLSSPQSRAWPRTFLRNANFSEYRAIALKRKPSSSTSAASLCAST